MGLEIDVFFSRLAVHDAALDRRAALDEAKLRVRRDAYNYLFVRGPVVMEEVVRAISDRMARHRRPRKLTYLGPDDHRADGVFYTVSVDYADGDRCTLSFCFNTADPDQDQSSGPPARRAHYCQVGWRIDGRSAPTPTRDWVDVSELGDENSFRAFFLLKLCHLLGIEDGQPYGPDGT